MILLVVVFISTALAIFYPLAWTALHPMLLPLLMILLFLSFVGMDFTSLVHTSGPALVHLGVLVTVKLIVLPVILYGIVLVLLPDFAIPVLLLSGISTGVVAPFVGSLMKAEAAPILRMVIITSVLVPFTLPVLVKALAGTAITIPLHVMVRLLAMVIFLPMAAVWAMRAVCPRFLDRLTEVRFPISMVLLAMVNLAVFSKYSSFFFTHPGKLIVAVGVAYALSIIYYLSGYVLTPKQGVAKKLSAGVSLAIINNVLVIVFAAEFFGPLSPTLAVMYMFPYYTMIVPMKLFAERVTSDPAWRTEPR